MPPHTSQTLTMATRPSFSEMKSEQDVAKVFDRMGYSIELFTPTTLVLRSGVLRKYLMSGMAPKRWEEIQQAYTSFFGQKFLSKIVEVEGPLGRLFNFIQSCLLVDHKTNLFKNGAGKTFLYELLTLKPPKNYRVSIATTTDPRHDWCGVDTSVISGVVDLLVRGVQQGSELALAVGEVKGDGQSGLWQLIAAMEAIQTFTGHWPIGMYFWFAVYMHV